MHHKYVFMNKTLISQRVHIQIIWIYFLLLHPIDVYYLNRILAKSTSVMTAFPFEYSMNSNSRTSDCKFSMNLKKQQNNNWILVFNWIISNYNIIESVYPFRNEWSLTNRKKSSNERVSFPFFPNRWMSNVVFTWLEADDSSFWKISQIQILFICIHLFSDSTALSKRSAKRSHKEKSPKTTHLPFLAKITAHNQHWDISLLVDTIKQFMFILFFSRVNK